jgi:hypothetical protein
MGDVVRRMSWSGANPAEAELLLRREWLVTNGLAVMRQGRSPASRRAAIMVC